MTHEIIKAVGYEIRVKNHLDAHWLAWFDGWTVTNLENGVALLRKLGVDQSALHGTLNKIRDLNLTLVAVNQIPEVDSSDLPPRG